MKRLIFEGLEARWAATLPADLLGKEGSVPYKIFRSKRTQKMVYEKGKRVFELFDPDGHAYVMQARASEFTMDSTPNLGEKLKNLPKGWKFRVRVRGKTSYSISLPIEQ